MGLFDRAWKDIKGLPGAALSGAEAGANEMLPHVRTPWGSTPRFGGKNGPDAASLTKGIAQQYQGIAQHPIRSFENHPINTLLALSPLKTLRSESAIVKAGEGASAREALIKAATDKARVHSSAGTRPSEMMLHLRGQLTPPVSKVSVATKAEGVARAQSAHAIRDGLSRPTEFGTDSSGLSFTNIKPDHNAGLRHVTVTKDGQPAGHITYHLTSNGKWMVQQIRVPEALRKQGIGTELFRKAEADVGVGKLMHQNDPSLLSPEGAGFAKSFEGQGPGVTGKGSERIGRAIFQDGERVPSDPTAYKKWNDRRAVEYYAKQPEYKPQTPVNEGPAGSKAFGADRKLQNSPDEGLSAARMAQLNQRGFTHMPLHQLMAAMEEAHMAGNTRMGDAIAGHIMEKHGFDPYEETGPAPTTQHPSKPPKGAPEWMKPYTISNKDWIRGKGVSDNFHVPRGEHGYLHPNAHRLIEQFKNGNGFEPYKPRKQSNN